MSQGSKYSFKKGQVVVLGERGGPFNWDYPQIEAEFLQDCDLVELVAKCGAALTNPGASRECNFANWLIDNNYIKVVEKRSDVSLTDVIAAAVRY